MACGGEPITGNIREVPCSGARRYPRMQSGCSRSPRVVEYAALSVVSLQRNTATSDFIDIRASGASSKLIQPLSRPPDLRRATLPLVIRTLEISSCILLKLRIQLLWETNTSVTFEDACVAQRPHCMGLHRFHWCTYMPSRCGYLLEHRLASSAY